MGWHQHLVEAAWRHARRSRLTSLDWVAALVDVSGPGGLVVEVSSDHMSVLVSSVSLARFQEDLTRQHGGPVVVREAVGLDPDVLQVPDQGLWVGAPIGSIGDGTGVHAYLLLRSAPFSLDVRSAWRVANEVADACSAPMLFGVEVVSQRVDVPALVASWSRAVDGERLDGAGEVLATLLRSGFGLAGGVEAADLVTR